MSPLRCGSIFHNPDELDRDLDGVGDICDNCTPLGWPLWFEPDQIDLAFANADQRNCNAEAETELMKAVSPSHLVGGLLRRVTAADYLSSAHWACTPPANSFLPHEALVPPPSAGCEGIVP